MRLTQFLDDRGKQSLAVTARGESRLVKGARTTLDLALQAIEANISLRRLIADRGLGKPVDLSRALKERRVLTPIDHKDPAHVFVTGTGLTHLGSAEGRDAMHRDLADPGKLTNSMRMFRLGYEGGKPEKGRDRAHSPSGSTRGTAQFSHRRKAISQVRLLLSMAEKNQRSLEYMLSMARGLLSVSVLRLAMSFQIISPKNKIIFCLPIQNSVRRVWVPSCWSVSFHWIFGASRVSDAAGRSSGSVHSCQASRIWPIRSRTWRRIISSTSCSDVQVTSTSISSERRPCRLPKA